MSPYHEYVNHMLRVYFARENLAADLSEVEKKNCAICEKILHGLSEVDRENLREIYSGADEKGLGAAVRRRAGRNVRVERELWTMVRAVTRDIARERGLIE